jgi:hypothetical protein
MNSLVSSCIRTVAILLAGAALVSRAAEDLIKVAPRESPQPWEKASIQFGGFLPVFNSELNFGVNNAAGVTLNGENLLGLESSLTVFRVEAMYRPGKTRRNQLDLIYASYDRNGSAILTKDLTIGDITIPVNARVDTVFDFDIIRLNYSYAVLQDDRMRIALGLGIYAVPLKYNLKYTGPGSSGNVEGADVTLPLPAVVLGGEFQLVPKLFLNMSIDAMYLEIGNFQGSLLDANVGLEYRPWKHIGLGLGYNGLSVHVEGKTSGSEYPGADFTGSVDVSFSGLMLYGKLSF